MLKYVAEFLGTLILLLAIVKYGKPIPIGLALTAAIFFFGHISGGHFNPAVSFMKFLAGGFPRNELIKYVLAQCLAAAVALRLKNL